jgi:ABC-type Fe3+ transport system substrate-binding protein
MGCDGGRIGRMALLALAVAGAVTAASAAELGPALQKLVAEADREGEIAITWSQSTMGGPRGAAIVEREINAMFGTRLHIKFTPGPSMPAVGNELRMRDSAGQAAQTDVYMAFSKNMSELVGSGLFLKVNWQELLPGRITEAMVEADGTLIKLVTSLPGATYNTTVFPTRPQRLTDFLEPALKGKLASTPYSASFDLLAAKDFWGPDQAVDFARKLSDQVSGLIRCDELERLASGEFAALVLDCDASSVGALARKGAPVAHTTLRDFPAMSFFYLSVPRRAVHPAAGTLFTVFTMTPQGQKIVWETMSTDLHLFPDSHLAATVAAVEAELGVRLKSLDIAWQLDNAAGRQASLAINKILTVKQ